MKNEISEMTSFFLVQLFFGPVLGRVLQNLVQWLEECYKILSSDWKSVTKSCPVIGRVLQNLVQWLEECYKILSSDWKSVTKSCPVIGRVTKSCPVIGRSDWKIVMPTFFRAPDKKTTQPTTTKKKLFCFTSFFIALNYSLSVVL